MSPFACLGARAEDAVRVPGGKLALVACGTSYQESGLVMWSEDGRMPRVAMPCPVIVAAGPSDAARIAELASTIWHEYYRSIIGAAQVAYMLMRFQSEAAILAQMAAGMEYALCTRGGEAIGYLAVQVRAEVLVLSKLYVLASERGQGTGRALLAEVRSRAESCGCSRIRLNVNRHNRGSIGIYEHCGFVRVTEEDIEIGAGFVLNDYVYELEIRSP